MPLCLLSAIGGVWLVYFVHGMWLAILPPAFAPTFLDNNIFTKIGFVVLTGLACKNAILLVFASGAGVLRGDPPRGRGPQAALTGYIPRWWTRNAHLSARLSTCIQVGVPAPWPARVSTRISTGLGQPWACWSAAVNL